MSICGPTSPHPFPAARLAAGESVAVGKTSHSKGTRKDCHFCHMGPNFFSLEALACCLSLMRGPELSSEPLLCCRLSVCPQHYIKSSGLKQQSLSLYSLLNLRPFTRGIKQCIKVEHESVAAAGVFSRELPFLTISILSHEKARKGNNILK